MSGSIGLVLVPVVPGVGSVLVAVSTFSAAVRTTPATGSGSRPAFLRTSPATIETPDCTLRVVGQLVGADLDSFELGASGLGAEDVSDCGRTGGDHDCGELHGQAPFRVSSSLGPGRPGARTASAGSSLSHSCCPEQPDSVGRLW